MGLPAAGPVIPWKPCRASATSGREKGSSTRRKTRGPTGMPLTAPAGGLMVPSPRRQGACGPGFHCLLLLTGVNTTFGEHSWVLGTRVIPPPLGQPGPDPGASLATGSRALLTACCSAGPQKSMRLVPSVHPSLLLLVALGFWNIPAALGPGCSWRCCLPPGPVQADCPGAGVWPGAGTSFHGFLHGRGGAFQLH